MASNSGNDQDHMDTCKLTGKIGKFVDSHIIPRALTRPFTPGSAFIQFGGEQKPSPRFDSWYDNHLVTIDGENILTDLDTYAIAELRRLKLVWQSWGPMVSLCTPDTDHIAGTANGIRRVVFSNPSKMRLYFLSLLWRAASSTKREFADIQLRPSEMRRLRRYVRDKQDPESWAFFPVTLTQISTLGVRHINAPMAQIKQSITVNGFTTKPQKIFRFFMDGLIAHVHMPVSQDEVDGMWPMLVGPSEGTTLSLVTWEGSRHVLDLTASVEKAESDYPGRIFGKGHSSMALAWAPAPKHPGQK